MIFQSYFIRKKIRTIVKNTSTRKSRFCTLAEAKTFIVTFNIKDRNEVLPCVEELNRLKKDVTMVVFIPKKMKIAEDIDPLWIQIKEDEFGSNGLPTPSLCEQFKDIPADILIDLTRTGDCAMHYLLLTNLTSFKVGNKSALRHLFDLTIPMGEDDNIGHFFRHILYYLQTIRSK
ncbi:MAG: hypothetical protein LBJ58_02350 [Tannerellaceae bacterium]|jgi:hypothetical protein|nr:hypothetical protein [Tannerellaceae bacterium]